jgi:DNA transformation protein and related proteins
MLARMAPSPDSGYKDFVLDQLAALPGLRARAMFGGHGLYRDEDFFGIVHRGRLFFKTDAASRAAYRERGMKPFRPGPGQTLGRYYEVPLEIAEDAAALLQWARVALAAGREDGARRAGRGRR